MRIYDLNNSIAELIEKQYECFDDDGVLIDEAGYNQILIELEEFQNQKDDLKKWILNKIQDDKLDELKLETEIKRLEELKSSLNKQIIKGENFAKYLFGELEKPIIFENYKIGYRKSTSVKTIDDFNVSAYIKEKVVMTKSVDKIKIAEDLKKGIEIPGASLEIKNNFYIK